jgi:hypothetical protein
MEFVIRFFIFSFSILAAAVTITACSTHPGAVNNQIYLPVPLAPVAPVGTAASTTNTGSSSDYPPTLATALSSSASNPPITALSGRVFVNGQIPTPAAHITFALYINVNDGWKKVSDFTTNSDGTFNITQSLERGKYEMRSLDKKFVGKMPITLDRQIRDLTVILEKNISEEI